MNLKKLEYFLVVAEEGSISRGAERLHMTQPPLSQALLSLEAELGVGLLKRLPRGVVPTPAGRLLVSQGRQLLRWAGKIEGLARELGAGEAGTLHVASVPTFSWSHLPPLLKAYGQKYPGVAVELSDPDPAGVLGAVAEGSADVGFVATSDVARLVAANPHLRIKHFVQMPLGLAVPPEASESIWQRCAYETWLVPATVPDFPGLQEITDRFWRDAGMLPERVQQVSTLQTAVPLIAAGMGVGLVPVDGVEVIGRAVKILEPPIAVAPLQGAMLWSAEMDPSPLLEGFLAVVDEVASRL